jgi:hypothetical protein
MRTCWSCELKKIMSRGYAFCLSTPSPKCCSRIEFADAVVMETVYLMLASMVYIGFEPQMLTWCGVAEQKKKKMMMVIIRRW